VAATSAQDATRHAIGENEMVAATCLVVGAGGTSVPAPPAANEQVVELSAEAVQEVDPEAEYGDEGDYGAKGKATEKKAWQPEEDARLIQLVTELGASHWSVIASYLEGRVGKQCRERWHNHLCPTVSKQEWTAEEDRLIMELVERYGTKWSRIAEMLPGRTDNSIKNRWNSTMRKNARRQVCACPRSHCARPHAAHGSVRCLR
jgi:hypothetical protein